MKVLIGIESCQHHRDYNKAQRETWVSSVTGADVIFFVGNQTLNKEQPSGYIDLDECTLNCPDDYKGLPHKTQAMTQYALDNGYDYLFKCDTDTYVVGSRLLQSHFEAYDYVGRMRDPSGGFPSRYASGGSGYWLSKFAMDAIANAEAPVDVAEDRWVANVLYYHPMSWRDDQRYKIILPQYMKSEGPHRGNDTISCCEFPGKAMHEVHNNWLNSSERVESILKRVRIK